MSPTNGPTTSPQPSEAATEAVWKALADPHRRRILDELRQAPRTTGQLAGHFEISRFGVMKHLGVLVDAGLVTVQRRGRERWNYLNAVPIQEIHRRWIEPFAADAADRLLRLRQLSEDSPAMKTAEMKALHAVDLTVQIDINAPRDKVWDAIVSSTSAWWHRDYYAGSAPRGFSIEPKLGGRMYEDWGDGQGLIWAVVTGVRTGEYLLLSGEMTRDFGGPSRNLTEIKLAEENGVTTVTLAESVLGDVSERTASSLDSGWRFLFGECLKAFVEDGRKAELPDTVTA